MDGDVQLVLAELRKPNAGSTQLTRGTRYG